MTSRLPDVGTTIFTTMSRLALEAGAINLSQGFPDFPVDPALTDLIARYLREGHNQYAPMPGAQPLRQVLSEVIRRTYQRPVDPEQEIVVTAGATQAIFSAIIALIQPGDEVIIFDPSYDSYDPGIRLSGGIPVRIRMQFPSFAIDWDEVRAHVTPRTRMIIINSPHNPTGTVLLPADLRKLEALALEHDLVVVSDEVYERLIFDDLRHESVLHYPALAARSVACFSFGKTFHATGWKVGFVTGPAALMAEIRKAHQYIVFSVNTPVQLAIAGYMGNPAVYEGLATFYQAKRDFFLGQLAGSPFRPLTTRGTYFQLVDYSDFSGGADLEVARELTVRHRVAAIPVSVFYRDGTDQRLLRFCFAKKDETLAAAGEVLRRL